MADYEVLAFRLLERFLKPLIPPDLYQALQPYFETARGELDDMSAWSSVKNWETKVHIVPPTQPLLPPEPPVALASEEERGQWQTMQRQVREAILEALFANKQCQIEYQQLWRDEPACWTIHPLGYLQRGPAFYLLCTIDEFTDVRQLALHRMRSAKVLDAKANQPKDFDLNWEVEHCQGMGGSGEPIRLAARFWVRAGGHLRETRLAADQEIEEIDDEHFRLTATVNDTAQLRWWLLSFGSSVEVLEPEGLRREMANQAYWMNRAYARGSSSE
ncbi:MAG: WYL domain-containing protein [Candidatus Competibacteraceae bacterium]